MNNPLAERARPQSFEDYIFSEFLKKELNKLKNELNYWNRIPSLLLWGPPGTGKTTFAFILIQLMESLKVPFSFEKGNAMDWGVKELKKFGEDALNRRGLGYFFHLLFIDEIHRLNRSQQDILLPFLEKGQIILIGATTENPGYEMNAALLSRLRTVEFKKHSPENLKSIALSVLKTQGKASDDFISFEALDFLIQKSDGDARKLLSFLEELIAQPKKESWLLDDIIEFTKTESFILSHDKARDSHYDTISAFIKSIRGSDIQAALYYLARMIQGGEDPLFIARRMIILASEDIGNADPRALTLAVSVYDAVKAVGLPEAGINLAQVVVYLSSAPKSNRSYVAYKKALKYVEKTGYLTIPKAIRSSQTSWSVEQGYGEGYLYSHEGDRGFRHQEFLPDQAKNEIFYESSGRGFEKNLSDYLDWMKNKKKN